MADGLGSLKMQFNPTACGALAARCHLVYKRNAIRSDMKCAIGR
ncbi:hypothetical protein [Kingella sp. (in: b-proteobacteria)]|nr:hypothetical protein [Kingella sp. (in: b-proteobacteria)]MDO4657649.1 hypothetical protein [Kingella sp. (in: b-proteobacteria)]